MATDLTMTPYQKLKWAVLAWERRAQGLETLPYPCPDVDELYDELVESGDHRDALSEIREGEVETELPCEWSRHYESKSVAMKMPDGSWVGWTYWYGGGKHGEPESIGWMEQAYDVLCHKEEKLTVVRTFKVVETNS